MKRCIGQTGGLMRTGYHIIFLFHAWGM